MIGELAEVAGCARLRMGRLIYLAMHDLDELMPSRRQYGRTSARRMVSTAPEPSQIWAFVGDTAVTAAIASA